MSKSVALILAAGLAAPLAFAVPPTECATTINKEDLAALKAIEASGLYRFRPASPDAPIVIGLSFHVIRRTDGTGAIPQAQLTQALIDANVHYATAGIQFCQVGQNRFMNSDQYYTIDNTSEANALRLIDVVPGTINIYFVGSAPFCGISSFTTSSVQGIVCLNACVGINTNPQNHSTFPHEIGHYFNLYHTHETAFGTECTNGSNCSTAGDLVCDTPADPNVLGLINGSCQWTGAATPPCGGSPAYVPPVRNIMSYSNKECRDHFTPQQQSRALVTLLNLRPELSRTICGPQCDANCDGSTIAPILNVNDFTCFLNRFAAGDLRANCDNSTTQPLLNINDFSCFLNKFAAGCT
ncbi:MAG: GC-type dockerin domain-anchored protein [Phycisphaerales bacterium]